MLTKHSGTLFVIINVSFYYSYVEQKIKSAYQNLYRLQPSIYLAKKVAEKLG